MTRTEISLGASNSAAGVVVVEEVVEVELDVVDDDEDDGSTVVAVAGTVVVRSGKLLVVVATTVVGTRESGVATETGATPAPSSEGNNSGIQTIRTQKINMSAKPPIAHLRTKKARPK